MPNSTAVRLVLITSGRVVSFVLLLLFSVLVYVFMRWARRANPKLKKIPALDAIDQVVGRCTEMGRPLMYGIGWGRGIIGGGLGGISSQNVVSIAGLKYVARRAAEYETRIIVPSETPMLVPLLSDTVQDAYSAAGKGDLYRETMIRFIPSQSLTYMVGVVGMMERENIAGNIWIGNVMSTVIMLVEVANKVGALQVIASDAVTNIPSCMVAADYVMIGEEMYAAGAILAKDPVQMGSIVGQDVGKLICLLLLAVGVILATMRVDWLARILKMWEVGCDVILEEGCSVDPYGR